MVDKRLVDAILYVLRDGEWHMTNKLHNESGLKGRFYGVLQSMSHARLVESTTDGLTGMHRLSDRGKAVLYEFNACPYRKCRHADVVHDDECGTCAVCTSKVQFGEPGEHPCAARPDVAR
jgi:hypothetical protein